MSKPRLPEPELILAAKPAPTRFPQEERTSQDSQGLRPVGTRWERIVGKDKRLVEVVKHVYDKYTYSWSERVELVQD